MADDIAFHHDYFTVEAEGDQTFELTYVPEPGSAKLHWGSVWQPPTEYTIEGRTIRMPDDGVMQAGDKVWVQYAYDPGAQ